MSNPKYAWSDLVHRGLPKRSGQERVSDFLEIYGLYDEETATDGKLTYEHETKHST